MEQILDLIRQILEGIWNFIANVLTTVFEWINQAFVWLINGLIAFFQWIGQAFNWIIEAIGTIIQWFIDGINVILGAIWAVVTFFYQALEMLYHFALAVITVIVQVIELVVMVIQLVIAIIGLVFSWIGQAITSLFDLMRAINDAQLQQIPYLPRCISAPLESEMCAVWYIADNTIFVGQPGQWIVPVLVLVIDIMIVIYVIRTVLKLVRNWEQFTDTTA